MDIRKIRVWIENKKKRNKTENHEEGRGEVRDSAIELLRERR